MITTHYNWVRSQEEGKTLEHIETITVVTPMFDSKFESFTSTYIGAMRYGKTHGCKKISFRATAASTMNPKIMTELLSVAQMLGYEILES